jgi:hypothetical protein
LVDQNKVGNFELAACSRKAAAALALYVVSSGGKPYRAQRSIAMRPAAVSRP